MSELKHPLPGDGSASPKNKPHRDYLNYFGKDRWIHLWLAEKRTKLSSVVLPLFIRIGLVPDTISYVGIALLSGVIFYFVRQPVVAVLFLLGHIICDGLDGAFARNTGKASQSGAFTDLVCDQFGMVVVAMMAILHHMVTPLIGAVYISLYLIVVVFGVIINFMGLGTRITITSKYFLYVVYLIWALTGTNYIPELMYFFSVIMVGEVVVGYLRLKRGIRKKFDTQVRFTEGDPYSGRLNYALNVAVPIIVLIAICAWANKIPIRAMLDTPKTSVQWQQGPAVEHDETKDEFLGIGFHEHTLLVLVRSEDGTLHMRRIKCDTGEKIDSFIVPEYVRPAFGSLPVEGNVLLLADLCTRLLVGIDIEASFARKRMVTVLNLPLGYVSLTAAATAEWAGNKVWLAANYLQTRKTSVIDPRKAIKKGNIEQGVIAWYTNGGFPSGMTVVGDTVIEFNKSPYNSLLYAASLTRLTAGKNLLEASKVSFLPPDSDAIGPVTADKDLIMLARNGRIFKLPVESLRTSAVGRGSADGKKDN